MEHSVLIARKNATARKADVTLQLVSAMKETVRSVGQGRIVSDPVKMASTACSALRCVDFAKEANPAIKRQVNVKSARSAIRGDYVRTNAS